MEELSGRIISDAEYFAANNAHPEPASVEGDAYTEKLQDDQDDEPRGNELRVVGGSNGSDFPERVDEFIDNLAGTDWATPRGNTDWASPIGDTDWATPRGNTDWASPN